MPVPDHQKPCRTIQLRTVDRDVAVDPCDPRLSRLLIGIAHISIYHSVLFSLLQIAISGQVRHALIVGHRGIGSDRLPVRNFCAVPLSYAQNK